jgi:acetolactate synthase-1/2/3 large subunit
VFVNGSYSTGTESLRRTYPQGAAVRAGNYDGGTFCPPPDFAKLAEAANCHGEQVTDVSELDDAIRRGLDVVRDGTPAVIAAHVVGPLG